MPNVPVTWLGHASFRIDTPGGKRIYIDPWLGNPKCPGEEHEPERIDVIALTHGHDDHVGETVELTKKFSPRVIAMIELRAWLTGQGLEEDVSSAMNKGGTVDADGTKFTMTDAKHSSSSPDGDLPRRARRATWSRSGTERRSTSPATRASSATCS